MRKLWQRTMRNRLPKPFFSLPPLRFTAKLPQVTTFAMSRNRSSSPLSPFPLDSFSTITALVWGILPGRKISDHSHLVSMRLECLPGLKQRLQAGKNTWPSIGAGSIRGVILGPLVMRHCYFGGFGLGHQFDSCA